ncbi:MAG: hypothetical protein N2Z81_08090 [Hydrogenothermaceae bacterium]|nr:hypothetical protein [Hydrogenothermaceae bacterium]
MKKLFLTLAVATITTSSFAITKADAEKKMAQYFGDTKNYTISVCESQKYYIGEVYLKGYEGVSTVRKLYVNKETGDIIPEMAQASDFCYMIK